MKKVLTVAIVLLCLLLCTVVLTCCVNSPDEPNSNDVSGSEKTTEKKENDGDSIENNLEEYDVFKGIDITFSGVTGYGICDLQKSNDMLAEIKQNISISLSNSKDLKNGDVITASISYDPNRLASLGYKVKADTMEFTVYGLQELIILDAFDGLELTLSGISPFVKVSFNNSECSDEVQSYVKYSIDGELFANGDKVVVTASIDEAVTREYGFYLEKSALSKEFEIGGMPYYLESLEGVDTALLENELNDYILSQISFDQVSKLFGIGIGKFLNKASTFCYFVDVNSVTCESSYFSVIKKMSKNEFYDEDIDAYNVLQVVTVVNALADHPNKPNGEYRVDGNIYVCFSINNIIMYPDGSIQWGTENPETFDVKYTATLNGIQAVKDSSIFSNSAHFNISELEKTDWINIE